MKLRIPTLDTAVWIAVAVALVVGLFLIRWIFSSSTVTVTNEHAETAQAVSPLSGIPCGGATRRPIAVMLSSDPEARPLSGVGQADMVFEMPVTPNGITRLMAVYQCQDPKELGSIRSARLDFIPLAQGVDAILAHWGGEQAALAELDAHVMDNVDALKYEGTTFYRKNGVPAPHDGFSTLSLIRTRADELGYRASTSLAAYVHTTSTPDRNLGDAADTVTVAWPQGMDVSFTYDADSNSYVRSRGGTPEVDATTGARVRASVVIDMRTDASFLRDQYIRVRTTGEGVATIWQGGRRINALWKKPSATDMLSFTDGDGQPIALVPGTIWVLVDAPLSEAQP